LAKLSQKVGIFAIFGRFDLNWALELLLPGIFGLRLRPFSICLTEPSCTGRHSLGSMRLDPVESVIFGEIVIFSADSIQFLGLLAQMG
jgi:hypothetical protein